MLQRTLSIIVLAPLLLGLLWKGSGFHLLLLAAPASALILSEWRGFSPDREASRSRLLLSTLLAWSWLAVGLWGGPTLLAALIPAGLFILMVAGMARHTPGGSPTGAGVAFDFLGLVWVALPMVLLVKIQDAAQGGLYVISFFLVLWGTDIGAYLAGRQWGVAKLAPTISPGKTRVGAVGGTLVGTLSGVAAIMAFSLAIPVLHAILLSLLLSLAGQVGDLAESLMKREAGVKDSGHLIPGHGGLFDRLDSALFAAPVFFIYLYGLNLL